MDAGLPLKQLIAPVAAATVVTAFWFAAMWKGHQQERSGKRLSWPYEVVFIGYIAVVGLFAYFRADLTSSAGLDLFGIALVGEGLGLIVTFALVQTFVLASGKPWRERAFPIVATLFLTGIIFGALLTS